MNVTWVALSLGDLGFAMGQTQGNARRPSEARQAITHAGRSTSGLV